MSLIAATDIGGTFTDLVVFDTATSEIGIAKASTTPARFAEGVMDSLATGAVPLARVEHLIHGTTIVINALTERKGAPTALVTTRGFRDVLEIGRGNRPDMYNLLCRKPQPFVPRRWRFEVTERVDRHGTVLVPLRIAELDAAVETCRAQGVEAIAICFLHAYAHPEHERAARDRILERYPGVHVSISSDITREFREYERTSTTVLNGYVQPVVADYLDDLGEALERDGLRGSFHVMQSSAGTASVRAARQRPISLVESGPAAGIIGAARIGEQIGEPNAIYLDIGGTTAKCSLIEGGEPNTTTEYKLEWGPTFAGYPVMVPVVDIVEIGAGGGSIAWMDDGGALKVGPKSAGADPGPACYGKGGESPTVTDAKLLAGVLNPEYILGGRLRVHPDRAGEAMRDLGARLGVTEAELANGVIRLVNASMINALKLVSVRRGHDPREFVLVACGGGGAMHAASLGAELGVKMVVVPPRSGVFSAWAMLLTEPRLDLVQTRVTRASETSGDEIDALFAQLQDEAAARFAEDRISPAALYHARSVDMRYAGQEHSVRVPVPSGPADLPEIEAAFHAEHRRKYTFSLPDTPIELVTFHLATHRRASKPELAAWTGGAASVEPKGRRLVDFDVDGVHETVILERDDLPTGYAAEGPLVIEESTTTSLIHPGQTIEIDRYGNLLVDVAARTREGG
jgi:N-methylhydantoinase A